MKEEKHIDYKQLKTWLEHKLGRELEDLLAYGMTNDRYVDWLAINNTDGSQTFLSCKLDEDEKISLVDNDNVEEEKKQVFVKHFLSKTLECQKTKTFLDYICDNWPKYRFLQDYSENSIMMELAIFGL